MEIGERLPEDDFNDKKVNRLWSLYHISVQLKNIIVSLPFTISCDSDDLHLSKIPSYLHLERVGYHFKYNIPSTTPEIKKVFGDIYFLEN